MERLKEYIYSLTDFSEESWQVLSGCMTELNIKRGERLLKEGEICRSVFFINSGFCKSVYNIDGKEINTAFYFENEFATNITSLVGEISSDYSITACENMGLIKFDKKRLLEAYAQSHEIEAFGRKLLEMIVARQEAHVNSFKLLSPRQRFNDMVSRYPDFLQRVSLTQIASYLGISRETLSRIRSER